MDSRYDRCVVGLQVGAIVMSDEGRGRGGRPRSKISLARVAARVYT